MTDRHQILIGYWHPCNGQLGFFSMLTLPWHRFWMPKDVLKLFIMKGTLIPALPKAWLEPATFWSQIQPTTSNATGGVRITYLPPSVYVALGTDLSCNATAGVRITYLQPSVYVALGTDLSGTSCWLTLTCQVLIHLKKQNVFVKHRCSSGNNFHNIN